MIHLHLHSTYSFLDGYGTPEQYCKAALENGEKAFALTEHGNIYSHVPFTIEAKKHGIKIIYGCEFYLENTNGKYFHITVLAQNNQGYANLCKMITLANLNFKQKPLLKLDQLIENQEGLIILSGCWGDGILHRLYQNKDFEGVIRKASELKRSFDVPFFIEIQHHNREELEFFRLVSKHTGIPCVPTCDVHYPTTNDYHAQDIMYTIGQHEKYDSLTRKKLYTNLYMLPVHEALEIFTGDEIQLTYDITDMCNVELPVFAPIIEEDAKKKLLQMVAQYSQRLGNKINNDIYQQRFLYELSIIDKLNLHTYFIIMADLVNYFKDIGYFIGVGRGSAAGSLISYLLGITEVDPIEYNLSFERFLDINRKDYPDIDTDFSSNARDKAIEYLKNKFGKDKIGRLCTFAYYKGSSVFWDIARIYGIDRRIAKELSLATISEEEIPKEHELYRKYPRLKEALLLEGQIRQISKHASGVIISPEPLDNFCATNYANGEYVLSIDKYSAEALGLLKLDILGLKTLDIIESVCKKENIDPKSLYRLEYNDPKVFDVFRKCEVAGVFQFEGETASKVLKEYNDIKSIEDLAFVSAVARPGALASLQNAFIPDCLKPFVYKQKYFVYQEELMAILRFLEFSWEEITEIRKGVTKKMLDKVKKYEQKFIDKLSKHCNAYEAKRFWELVLKTGEYSFNKSHAVSYAILSYITAYLKIYHTKSFIESYLDLTDDDVKRRNLVREFINKGYTIELIGNSISFEVRDKTIYGSLTAIKGIGEVRAMQIIQGKSSAIFEKAKNEPYKFVTWCNLDDFGNRYNLSNLPLESELSVTARVTNVEYTKCLLEDKYGCCKAYFNPRFVKLEENEVYRLFIRVNHSGVVYIEGVVKYAA